MSSRESALGAWADKIPQVDGWTPNSAWQDEPLVNELPLEPDQVAHHLKQAGILFLLGLAPILIAAGLLIKDIHILSGERTSGTISELRGGRHPVARFYVHGEKYFAIGYVSSRSSLYQVGDKVNVRYCPDDPSEALIDGFLQLYLFPSILAGVGSMFALTAVGCAMWTVRQASCAAAAGTEG